MVFLASPLPSHGEKQSFPRQTSKSWLPAPPLWSHAFLALQQEPPRTATPLVSPWKKSTSISGCQAALGPGRRGTSLPETVETNPSSRKASSLQGECARSPTSLFSQEVWLLRVPATQKSPYISTMTSKLPQSVSVPTAFEISTIWGKNSFIRSKLSA